MESADPWRQLEQHLEEMDYENERINQGNRLLASEGAEGNQSSHQGRDEPVFQE